MRRWLATALVGVVVLLTIACDDQGATPTRDSLGAVVDAAGKTLAVGPASVRATVVGDGGEYALSGALDPSDGYRLCAEIDRAPEPFLRGQAVWLEGRRGTYGTLISPRSPCPDRGWIDDHPPTLPLSGVEERPAPRGGETGAEDFLHAALLALTRMESAAVEASLKRQVDGSMLYDVVIDFTRFDEDPSERDEDTWTLRPLLRSLGRSSVEAKVRSDGVIERLRFAAPGLHGSDPTPSAVPVDVRLSELGEAPSVPRVEATSIE